MSQNAPDSKYFIDVASHGSFWGLSLTLCHTRVLLGHLVGSALPAIQSSEHHSLYTVGKHYGLQNGKKTKDPVDIVLKRVIMAL